ncbi:DNA polymerase Y family protein [Nocardioides alcanivorans]|uniref:DNA polymerase Y family protein n=1 Tax=Nocardioides alcanivorans TaxID=2897352 RepID=UPI001F30BC87|nr:DNA polymerase Y family protein [Nocardioides alcanivorans]
MAGRRVLVAWCPDWPVLSAMAEAQVPPSRPAAVLSGNQVSACNDAARADKVRRGMRRRDAQSRCPDLHILAGNPEREARDFEPVLACLEELSPGIAALRPGLAALRSPARYYGGEREAAAVISEKLVGMGIWDCRFGIADDLFTAEQAARAAEQQDSAVVPPGGSAAFLARLDVRVLDDPETTDPLRRLGIRTLGDLASLPSVDVLARFGASGARLHRLARGGDTDRLRVRQPPPDLVCQVDFEPPLASVESVVFSVRRTAEQFVHQIGSRNLVCTRVLVEAESEGRITSSRLWVHARWFRASDLLDRVHWQLSTTGDRQVGPISCVRFVPEAVEADVVHADGLWGNADASQVERGVARVQALLGFESVVQPVLQGGRSPALVRPTCLGVNALSACVPATSRGRAASRRPHRPGCFPNRCRPRCSTAMAVPRQSPSAACSPASRHVSVPAPPAGTPHRGRRSLPGPVLGPSRRPGGSQMPDLSPASSWSASTDTHGC